MVPDGSVECEPTPGKVLCWDAAVYVIEKLRERGYRVVNSREAEEHSFGLGGGKTLAELRELAQMYQGASGGAEGFSRYFGPSDFLELMDLIGVKP